MTKPLPVLLILCLLLISTSLLGVEGTGFSQALPDCLASPQPREVEQLQYDLPILQDACQLLQDDQPEDGQGIYWDGLSAQRRRDELDDPFVLDGRGGLFSFEDIVLPGGYIIQVPYWPGGESHQTETTLICADDELCFQFMRGTQEDIIKAVEEAGTLFSIEVPEDDGQEYLHLTRHAGAQYLGYACLLPMGGEYVLFSFTGIGFLEDIAIPFRSAMRTLARVN